MPPVFTQVCAAVATLCLIGQAKEHEVTVNYFAASDTTCSQAPVSSDVLELHKCYTDGNTGFKVECNPREVNYQYFKELKDGDCHGSHEETKYAVGACVLMKGATRPARWTNCTTP